MPRPRFEAWNCSRPSYHSLPVPSQSKRHQSRFLRFRTAHLEFCNASPACRILSEDHGFKAQHVVSTWLESFTACSKHDRKKHQTILSCRLWWSLDLQLWTSKPMNQWWMSCGDFGNPLINPGSSPNFQSFPNTSTASAGFWWLWIQTTSKFGGFIISPNQLIDDCVTGLSHNAVWRSCIHKDVRDRGGLATWMNVAGGSKISQRSQSIAINTITAIRTIDSTNCAQIYLDWLGYLMKIGGIK